MKRENITKQGKSGLSWILRHTRTYYPAIAAVTILSAVSAALSVGFSLLLRSGIDAAVAGNRRGFLDAVVFIGMLLLFQMCAWATIRLLEEWIRSGVENTLKNHIYRSLLRADYEAVSGLHTGELMNRLTSDTVQVADGVTLIIPGVIALLVRLIGAAYLLMLLEPRFLLFFLSGGVLMLLGTALGRTLMKRLHKNVQEKDGVLRSFLQETLGNLLVVLGFSGEARVASVAEDYMSDHRRSRLKKTGFYYAANFGFVGVMNVGYVLGILWCGMGILNHTVTYGTLTAVIQLVGQLEAPLANLTSYVPKFFGAIASAERLLELEALGTKTTSERTTDSPVGVQALREDWRALRAEGLTFSYDGQKACLKDFTVELQRGEYAAITGPSGIGKSTLLKLMLGVYHQQSGRLLCVTKDGQEHVLNRDTRTLFAYVPQGNFLLSGTIFDAITFFGPASDDRKKQLADVMRACEIACADFIRELPKGLETTIGEKGAGLSEGQIQRIAIARAIYSGAPVLLLDEATSALDEATELRLLENLRGLTDKTVLIVTHRMAVLRICNKEIRLGGE